MWNKEPNTTATSTPVSQWAVMAELSEPRAEFSFFIFYYSDQQNDCIRMKEQYWIIWPPGNGGHSVIKVHSLSESEWLDLHLR